MDMLGQRKRLDEWHGACSRANSFRITARLLDIYYGGQSQQFWCGLSTTGIEIPRLRSWGVQERNGRKDVIIRTGRFDQGAEPRAAGIRNVRPRSVEAARMIFLLQYQS